MNANAPMGAMMRALNAPTPVDRFEVAFPSEMPTRDMIQALLGDMKKKRQQDEGMTKEDMLAEDLREQMELGAIYSDPNGGPHPNPEEGPAFQLDVPEGEDKISPADMQHIMESLYARRSKKPAEWTATSQEHGI
jgi:hypothetical protein